MRQHDGVVDDPIKIHRAIQERERAEGAEGRMDKKSLLRLLIRLSEDGAIRNVFVKLRSGERSRTLHFVCEPDVDENHTVIRFEQTN